MTDKITVDSRADLSRLLGFIFDRFSLHVEDLTAEDWPWPTNYTRQMLATLVRSGIVVVDHDVEGETFWQCWKTYDDHEFAEVLGDFDAWFDNNATSTESETPMSTTASTRTKPEANTPCYCGCGEKSKGFYRPGHDARHAGVIGRKAAEYAKQAGWSVVEPKGSMKDLFSDLPSEALVDKAIKIGNNALAKANKKSEPAHLDGTIKVGKKERVARKFSSSNAVSYLDDEGNWVEASKTAAKTFQVG